MEARINQIDVERKDKEDRINFLSAIKRRRGELA